MRNLQCAVTRQFLAVVVASCFFGQQVVQAAGSASSVPTSGKFVAGSGSIQSSPSSVTVNQSSLKGIIDWKTFSLAAGSQINFLNGSGATLNRVTSDQMSLLLGRLNATGTVYLINPNGVLIGPKGQIRTGGDFVASTLNVSNQNFFAGGALLFQGGSASYVKNLGTVSSTAATFY